MPVSLCALLVCVALVGCAWALVLPAWQGPDELAHTAYVQSLAERGSIPEPDGPMMSSEQLAAGAVANTYQVAGVLLTDPEWSPRAAAAFLARKDLKRDDGGGANPARVNPPSYYLYESVPYKLAESGSIWARMLAMRLASVLWLLVTVTAAWLLAGQIFRRDRRLRLVAAGFTGLLPMMTSVSGSVNPDAMMIALWTLALWLGVATLREQSWRTGLALGLVVGLAVVTKSTSYALLPPALLVLLITAWRTGVGRSKVAAAGGMLAALLVFAIPVIAWLAVAPDGGQAATAQLSGTTTATAGGTNLREFFSYVWQFYLPGLPFQTDYEATHPDFQVEADGLPLYATWIRTGWAAFGYLEVQFPNPVYWGLAAASAAIVVAFFVSLRGRLRRLDWATAAFFGLLIALLLGGVHWTEYHTIADGGKGFSQGRYLLPLAAIGGIVVAQATRIVPARGRVGVQASILGALVVLQLFSLALVLSRFYA